METVNTTDPRELIRELLRTFFAAWNINPESTSTSVAASKRAVDEAGDYVEHPPGKPQSA